MNLEIKEIAKKIGEERGIPIEAKKSGNFYLSLQGHNEVGEGEEETCRCIGIHKYTSSEKLRIVGSDMTSLTRFFESPTRNRDSILKDLSSISSESENIRLVKKRS